MKYLLVFVIMVLTDAVWAYYIRRTGQGKALSSALTAVALLLLGAYVVLSYTENHLMLIPSALGAFVGTYLTVKFDHKGDK